MLKGGHGWADSIVSDLTPIPIPVLKPSRVLHIHQTILPHIGKNALPWWYSIAPESVAREESERINREKEPRRKKKKLERTLKETSSYLCSRLYLMIGFQINGSLP